MKIQRERFVIVTFDEKQIFCGLARHYQFKDINNIGDTPFKTYLSEKKAISSFLSSWYSAKEEDFSPNGKYKVMKVLEKLETI